jgi:putative hydrolase of the HAD superfamily
MIADIHTVVFDLDDTLYPERDYVLSGFRAVDDWLRAERGVGGFAERATRLFDHGHRGRIFDEVLKGMGIADASALVPQLVAVYRGHTPRIVLPRETEDLLAWARSRFRLALISDGYLETQKKKVMALGLERWIDCAVFSDQWGRDAWKPSERPFREVMIRLPGEAAGYVYVADNPGKDFVGPRRLGWRTVRLRRTGGEHALKEPEPGEAADVEIGALGELRSMLVPAGQA